VVGYAEELPGFDADVSRFSVKSVYEHVMVFIGVGERVGINSGHEKYVRFFILNANFIYLLVY
jgi:hypothetical protein